MLTKPLCGTALIAALISLPGVAAAHDQSGYRDREYTMRDQDRDVPSGWQNRNRQGHDHGFHYGRGHHYGSDRDDRLRDRDRDRDRDD